MQPRPPHSPASRPTPPATGAAGPAQFETIRTVRTFETAIEHIVEGLERARLRRGDRLPNEAQLANQLGISKPTLRQALLVLERAGLLDVRLGKTGGVFVASDLVPDDAISTAVALEERAVVDVLHGRRVIETAVVHYATAVADAGDYAELERSIELVRAHLGDRTAVMGADAMFHRVLVRACRNETMRAAMRCSSAASRRSGTPTAAGSTGTRTSSTSTRGRSPRCAPATSRRSSRSSRRTSGCSRTRTAPRSARSWRQLFGRGIQPAA